MDPRPVLGYVLQVMNSTCEGDRRMVLQILHSFCGTHYVSKVSSVGIVEIAKPVDINLVLHTLAKSGYKAVVINVMTGKVIGGHLIRDWELHNPNRRHAPLANPFMHFRNELARCHQCHHDNRMGCNHHHHHRHGRNGCAPHHEHGISRCVHHHHHHHHHGRH